MKKPRSVQVQKVRKVYVGGKRNEALLRGKCGFIGGVYEVLVGDGGIGTVDLPHYLMARRAYYRLHPDHPNHPIWRPECDDKFAVMLSGEAKNTYRRILVKAIEAWRLKNPQAEPVHPESADWKPEWDLLKDDADKLWPPRMDFLLAKESEFRMVPDLWQALCKQMQRFMRDFYEPIDYDD